MNTKQKKKHNNNHRRLLPPELSRRATAAMRPGACPILGAKLSPRARCWPFLGLPNLSGCLPSCRSASSGAPRLRLFLPPLFLACPFRLFACAGSPGCLLPCPRTAALAAAGFTSLSGALGRTGVPVFRRAPRRRGASGSQTSLPLALGWRLRRAGQRALPSSAGPNTGVRRVAPGPSRPGRWRGHLDRCQFAGAAVASWAAPPSPGIPMRLATWLAPPWLSPSAAWLSLLSTLACCSLSALPCPLWGPSPNCRSR